MIRTLLNDGRLERDGETFRPVGDIGDLAVPESLHALIAARIDALPPAERTLLQDASVLGLSFADEAVQAVARSGPDEIGPMLEHLVRRELLIIDDDPRSPERGNYRFVQGLLREVAYGTLSRDDRRARHLAAARHYESLGDDELAGVLAQHYVDAYQAHPDGEEGAAVAAQARVALRAAAQRAADLGSLRAGARLSRERAPGRRPTLPTSSTFARWRSTPRPEPGSSTWRSTTETGPSPSRARSGGTPSGVSSSRASPMLLTEGQQQRALELLNATIAEPDFTPDTPGYIEVATILAKAEMRALNQRALRRARGCDASGRSSKRRRARRARPAHHARRCDRELSVARSSRR